MLVSVWIQILHTNSSSYFLQIRSTQNKTGLMKIQQSFSRMADSLSTSKGSLGSHLQSHYISVLLPFGTLGEVNSTILTEDAGVSLRRF